MPCDSTILSASGLSLQPDGTLCDSSMLSAASLSLQPDSIRDFVSGPLTAVFRHEGALFYKAADTIVDRSPCWHGPVHKHYSEIGHYTTSARVIFKNSTDILGTASVEKPDDMIGGRLMPLVFGFGVRDGHSFAGWVHLHGEDAIEFDPVNQSFYGPDSAMNSLSQCGAGKIALKRSLMPGFRYWRLRSPQPPSAAHLLPEIIREELCDRINEVYSKMENLLR